MAISVQNFIKLVNFYNQTMITMSAICVQKGGISMDHYVGRFYVADLLEYIVEYGKRLEKNGEVLSPEIVGLIDRLEKQFDKIKSFVTPTQKPIHEMTLEEFEKFMNI